jgi:hypothetical protein
MDGMWKFSPTLPMEEDFDLLISGALMVCLNGMTRQLYMLGVHNKRASQSHIYNLGLRT